MKLVDMDVGMMFPKLQNSYMISKSISSSSGCSPTSWSPSSMTSNSASVTTTSGRPSWSLSQDLGHSTACSESFCSLFRLSVSIILHCEKSLSTPADIDGMDRISSAIEEKCVYICCWDCQKANGLVIDGPVGVERYLSYLPTVQLSDWNQLESIEGRVTNYSALPMCLPGCKWSTWRWRRIRLAFSIWPYKWRHWHVLC